MSRYKIWNGTDTIYTFGPPYKFTPDAWRAKYPWAEVATCVISGQGTINGAFCMPLENMVATATAKGCDLSGYTTDEEKLAAIEAFEDEQAAEAAAKAEEEAATAALNASSMASIAASLEYQNLLTLDDAEEE